jgi:hypothetical protein
MSDRGHLPEFVRTALEDGEGSITCSGEQAEAVPAASASESASSSREGELLGIERTWGALLDAACPEDPNRDVGVGPGPVRHVDDAPSAALFERLEATIGQAPHCYAPFFAKAAELFDLPEAVVIEQLARLREPAVWSFAGLPGIHHVRVDGGPKVRSAETLFVRFSPGVRFPEHRHTGPERVLVLEGHYRDSRGVVHRPGELRDWAVGSEHGFVVDAGQPCIFASVVFGRRFSAWPLRALAFVLGS